MRPHGRVFCVCVCVCMHRYERSKTTQTCKQREFRYTTERCVWRLLFYAECDQVLKWCADRGFGHILTSAKDNIGTVHFFYNDAVRR
jgi:hypothetical protein